MSQGADGRRLALGVIVTTLMACPNFDRLEADALDAGASVRVGSTAGGSGGGAPSGTGGGFTAGLTLTSVFSRTNPIARLASTGGILFVGMTGASAATVDAVLPNQGGLVSRTFSRTELDDLDARHGEAAACSGLEVAVFSGNLWREVDAGIALGRCLSSTLSSNGGATQIPVWWKLNDGGVAVLPVSMARTGVEQAVPVGFKFDRLSVRPFADGGTFFSGTDNATLVGTVSSDFMVKLRDNAPLMPPLLAASQTGRLVAAGSMSGQVGLLVWEPSPQGTAAVESERVRVTNSGSAGVSVHALAVSGAAIAFVAEAMGSPGVPLTFNWTVDGGAGVFTTDGPFVAVASGNQLRWATLAGTSWPYALTFDETNAKLYLAHGGADGGSQLVLVGP